MLQTKEIISYSTWQLNSVSIKSFIKCGIRKNVGDKHEKTQ